MAKILAIACDHAGVTYKKDLIAYLTEQKMVEAEKKYMENLEKGAKVRYFVKEQAPAKAPVKK